MSERLLIVRPLGGLANRLRVVASADTTARFAGRELRLDWRLDRHFGAPWDALFENEIEAFSGSAPAEARIYEGEVVNFAVPGPGDVATDAAPVTWVRTCFNFKPRALGLEQFLAEKSAFYRRLRPIAAVRERLERVAGQFEGRPVVGVHIRRTDLVLVGDPPQYISPTASFLERMRRLVAAQPATLFFLATDDADEEAAIRAAFPDRVVLHPKRERGRDGVAGLQDALVDWLALARTGLILRSAGTSFSREAAIAGQVPRETIKRRLWPYNRRRFWAEAWRRRITVARRRFQAPRAGS